MGESLQRNGKSAGLLPKIGADLPMKLFSDNTISCLYKYTYNFSV